MAGSAAAAWDEELADGADAEPSDRKWTLRTAAITARQAMIAMAGSGFFLRPAFRCEGALMSAPAPDQTASSSRPSTGSSGYPSADGTSSDAARVSSSRYGDASVKPTSVNEAIRQ